MTTAATYRGSDFYCDVAIPLPERLDLVRETGRVLGFYHMRPFWAVHIVVVPERHIGSLTTVGELEPDDVGVPVSPGDIGTPTSHPTGQVASLTA